MGDRHMLAGTVGTDDPNASHELAEATVIGCACSAFLAARSLRFPVPDLRLSAVTEQPFRVPTPLDCAASRRYQHRPRKLTSVDDAEIRALAATKSLRSLAADFGVSHETIRSFIQRCLE